MASQATSEPEPWLARAARRRPDVVALETPDGVLTYRELHARCAHAARQLDAMPGDHVQLDAMPGEPFVVSLHACLLAGAVAVPTRGSDPLSHSGDAGKGSDPFSHSGDSDPGGVLVHTSGSTAAPKPVVLTPRNWLWSALGSGVALGVDPRERWLCTLPLNHVGGLSILLRSAIYATTAVVHQRFDAERVLHALREERITLVSLVPTTLARLLDAGLERPPHLRTALLGGAPIAPALLERARAAGVPVTATYGLTEACSQVATDGWPLFCTRVRLDPADGEILVSGPTVANGAELRTGDLGAWGPDGRLQVVGRKADTIITGGENVAPAEVEAALEEHPAVAEAGVHAVPDDEWGEAVHAVVVLRPEARASERELREHMAARLARFKAPKAIRFAAALPRTPSGKLRRDHLSRTATDRDPEA